MIPKPSKPTEVMYAFLQNAYDFFNDKLFGSQLPPCLMTLQREKNTMGYFSSNRWIGDNQQQVHEIALNPAYFITHKPLELMQTIVHEMCHLWQHEFGKPSHRTYHNKEWADKMESIGLMPSSTGQPGGKRTGQKMSDYPIPNGAFYLQCLVFAQMGYQLPFYDRFAKKLSAQIRMNELEAILRPQREQDNYLLSQDVNIRDTDTDSIEVEIEISEAAKLLMQPFSEQFDIDVAELTEEQEAGVLSKRKTTYLCQSCGDKAWGKPTLNLWCGNCQLPMAKLDSLSEMEGN